MRQRESGPAPREEVFREPGKTTLKISFPQPFLTIKRALKNFKFNSVRQTKKGKRNMNEDE